MTKEEAIKILKENYCAMCAYDSQDMDSCDIHSCDNKDAIKALEQESKTVTLDKIKAEIENYKLSEDELSDADEDSVKWGMKIAYDIVNKYKAESEGV